MAYAPPENLQREFAWYLKHQADLVAQFNGRVVVIKDEQVIGDFADVAEAVRATQVAHPIGTFLVQKVEPGPDAYTATFHSRVSFQPSR
jgi:hypothetical protein